VQEIIHIKLGEGRRVAIPADLCQRYGIQPGDPLVLEASDHAMILRPLDEVLREVQAYFRDAAPPAAVVSDELIRERREEAKREGRD
jgi:bifunctional DNA-binding transcriptional regulator/antitoxin component of YhaV-PrlF toxin-antitoxin module